MSNQDCNVIMQTNKPYLLQAHLHPAKSAVKKHYSGLFNIFRSPEKGYQVIFYFCLSGFLI